MQTAPVAPTGRPCLSSDLYAVCMPSASGHLPLKQDTLTKEEQKYVRLKDEFCKIVAEHDKKYNPSGVPYRGERTRSAPEAGQEEVGQVGQGDRFPESDTFESLEKVKATMQVSTAMWSSRRPCFT